MTNTGKTHKRAAFFAGPVAVSGNTYAEYTGQGLGCRTDNSTQTWCQKSEADFCGGKDQIPNPIPASGDTCGGQTAPVPLRAATIGGQCSASEKSLPPRCSSVSDGLDAADDHDAFAACAKIPGKQTPYFAPFIYIMHQFTKTGSGQT
jgi:hypothetical protein